MIIPYEYQRPSKSGKHKVQNSPGFMQNALWIRIKALIISGQSAMGRQPASYTNEGTSFLFLAPKEFIESTAHEWADYESLVGRMAQKFAEFRKYGGELTGTARTLVSGALSAATSFNWQAAYNSAVGGLSQIQVSNYRIDAPLYYKGSERRKFDFVFQLVEEGNPQSDIVEPVRKLQQLSSPTSQGALFDISPPCIFTLETVPSSFLRIERSVLVSVQPTWKGPFMKGYPSSCELVLSFVDMMPLFDSSFTGLVNVGQIGEQFAEEVEGLMTPKQIMEKRMDEYYKETPLQKGTGPLRDVFMPIAG